MRVLFWCRQIARPLVALPISARHRELASCAGAWEMRHLQYGSEVMLVPELDVTELATSLRFYAMVLEFRTLFERPAERFAYLERNGVGLMIQEADGPGRRFRTSPLEPPCGRGVNFELRVEDIDAVHARAVEGALTSLCRWRSAGTG